MAIRALIVMAVFGLWIATAIPLHACGSVAAAQIPDVPIISTTTPPIISNEPDPSGNPGTNTAAAGGMTLAPPPGTTNNTSASASGVGVTGPTGNGVVGVVVGNTITPSDSPDFVNVINQQIKQNAQSAAAPTIQADQANANASANQATQDLAAAQAAQSNANALVAAAQAAQNNANADLAAAANDNNSTTAQASRDNANAAMANANADLAAAQAAQNNANADTSAAQSAQGNANSANAAAQAAQNNANNVALVNPNQIPTTNGPDITLTAGQITIPGGTQVFIDPNSSPGTIQGSKVTSLTVNGGTITTSAAPPGYPQGTKTISVNGGTITFNGGTVTINGGQIGAPGANPLWIAPGSPLFDANQPYADNQ